MHVNTDNPTSATYSNNPLIKPLIKFHGKIASSFGSLPSKGKILEIAKRVVIIAVSLFAYLALGLLALTGLALNTVRNTTNRLPSRPLQTPSHLISVASECDTIKQQFISTVNKAKEINQLQSAKIFIDIECDHKKFSKDHIVKQLDSSHFDQVFLSKIADTILTEAKDFLEIQNAVKLSFKWTALLKDKDGVFHGPNGSRKCFYDKGQYRSENSHNTNKGIDANCLEEYFKLVLKEMGREIKPQLDDQLNFI